MPGSKRKAVISAEKEQLDRVEKLVRTRAYRTVSHFVREAIDEKLRRFERQHLADLVDRYCAAGYSDEDADLVAGQAFTGKGRRAKR